MRSLTTWLADRGPLVAAALDQQRDPICTLVTRRLSTTYAGLLAGSGADSDVRYQRMTFSRTPQRLHRLVQVALRLQAPTVLEREIEFSTHLLERHGITQHHMQTMVRWYFEAARSELPLSGDDAAFLDEIEALVLAAIRQSGEGSAGD